MATEQTTELLGKTREELRALCVSLGEPAYRGDQIYTALYAERKFDLGEATNLPAALREKLQANSAVKLPVVKRRFHSADGSIRYLFELSSGSTKETQRPASVEAVFMPSEGRQTLCISTQAGCAVNCQFCLTAKLGLIRNLTAGEILAQVLIALEENKEALTPHTNVVFMGQGEPLLNFDAVMTASTILQDQKGVSIPSKRITISTSGIVPGIERLAEEEIRPKLAISLNASNNEQRDAIMPINRKYPLERLLEACRKFPLRTWEFLMFEYVMLGGINDAPEDAKRVVKLLAGLKAKVNLIPWNPGDLPFRESTEESILDFQTILMERGIATFIRRSRGRDVMAACGQLALLDSADHASSALVRL
ncbi:MAG TPA: 23S rRNA (adenine(2503)-C(2))-methyltransferase RlmN [Candidatus Acidoferrum sp.]|jgi:23S rRNA (adenine2503-C2)-methyltransferase